MSTITKERIANLLQFNSEGSDCQANAEQWEVHELARIALASIEAEPAIHRWRRVTSEPYGPYPWHYGDFIGFSNPVDGIEDEYFYSAPPAPAPVSDEDKVLAEQARAVIHCLDMCGVPSGDYADNEQLQLWGRVIEYGRHPASVSVPDGYRLQPISEYDAMCAAMLQGAEPVTTANKLPFEQWLSQQTGTIDVECGCVMTEVFFHWLRVAYEAGNSPVIPDGWVLVPVEPTIAILDEFDSIIDYGAEDSKDAWSRLLAAAWIKSLPAAPQQEVESQIRKGKTVAREEWELGARLTKHRFKP
ncbi:hypothetical protein I4P42_10140 [Enterobacter roggenkampii]|uniref:hypothetical protein n=1 Tax=Enterobacter roggenkampii TaxID=1812935 RepID=UPI00079A0F00|nr:hypothetical protein [Enterobacter roggenkampii]MBG0695356.1 hypothetical protein [Enterobacter roggenkampii]CZZ87430.1 Uncharacterised protein [Enterobacter roggenkampii]HCR0801118.1 hypothetical protein [Enterobacter roggenkampii]